MLKFISFEGPEACGKSTQIQRLQKRLQSISGEVLLTREPGGTPVGEVVRHLLKHAPEGKGMTSEAELLLFAASRAELSRTVIAPALARGAWVLSDRYADSTQVFQGIARGLPREWVRQVNAIAMGETAPALTFLLDVPVEESLRRIAQRPRTEGEADHLEDQPREFFEKVRQGYQDLAREFPNRIVTIDGTGSADQVESQLWERVRHAFSL